MDYLITALLLIAGLILIILEVLILPGIITGMIGFLLIVSSIIYAFVHFGYSGGLIVILLSILSFLALIIIMKKLKVWNRFVLSEENRWKLADQNEIKAELINKEGISLTDLKPSGFILVDSKKFDANSEGEFIPKSSKVKILSIEGRKIIVKKIEE